MNLNFQRVEKDLSQDIQVINLDHLIRPMSGAKPKLPKLYCPKFKGDITKFTAF